MSAAVVPEGIGITRNPPDTNWTPLTRTFFAYTGVVAVRTLAGIETLLEAFESTGWAPGRTGYRRRRRCCGSRSGRWGCNRPVPSRRR
jgi:hypothetical protein